MITCKRCGKENHDHYKFCLGCGIELGSPAKERDGAAAMSTMMAGAAGRVQPTPPGGVKPGASPRRPSSGGDRPGSSPLAASPAAAAPGSNPGHASLARGQAAAPVGPPPGVPGGSSHYSPRPVTATSSATRQCPQCRAEVPTAFRFCGNCGAKMDAPAAPAPRHPPAPQQEAGRASLTLIRPDGSEGGVHALRQGDNKIGRNHGELFYNDGYLSPTHALLVIDSEGALIRDLGSLNGVFVKMTGEEEISPGQIIRIGQELIRFNTIEPPQPLEDGTEVMGSPNPGYWGKITVIIGDGVDGSAFPLLGESVTLGRERGDINFPEDGYVSGVHARLGCRRGAFYVTDLGSSNGTFLRIQGERRIENHTYLLMGQQLFRLGLPS